jgi:hypothetical protein
LLANASCQLIKDALTHRNRGHGADVHRMYRPHREQAHSHRNGVCCATAQRLDDEGIPALSAPRKTASTANPLKEQSEVTTVAKTPDTPHIQNPHIIRRSRLAGEGAQSADINVADPPQSRASSLPQGRRLLRDSPASGQGWRLLRDSAASGRRGNSQIPRPAHNRVNGKSPVGAIGGNDGREEGRSVTSRVLGTPQSRASALLHIARQPAFSSSHGRRC